MTRPYISLSIAELESLATEDPVDGSSLGLLIDELRHRHGPRARRLLSKLDASLDAETTRETSVEQAQVVSSTHDPTPPDSAGVATIPSDESLRQAAEDYGRLLRKYEDLRMTFTVEAELLARWGMTPHMPRYMQEQIIGEWRKQLAQEPDTLGRSVRTLETDFLRIDDERLLLRKRTSTTIETPVNSKKIT